MTNGGAMVYQINARYPRLLTGAAILAMAVSTIVIVVTQARTGAAPPASVDFYAIDEAGRQEFIRAHPAEFAPQIDARPGEVLLVEHNVTDAALPSPMTSQAYLSFADDGALTASLVNTYAQDGTLHSSQAWDGTQATTEDGTSLPGSDGATVADALSAVAPEILAGPYGMEMVSNDDLTATYRRIDMHNGETFERRITIEKDTHIVLTSSLSRDGEILDSRITTYRWIDRSLAPSAFPNATR